MSKLNLSAIFPFELDEFQLQAIAALDAGKSVVVCAPTGSGKTLIGEYTIYRALARGGRVFYTTPLKALSNQKLRDFRQQFGAENVGLLTGDTSVNRDAPILVMTTEIFRNMLYGTPIGQVGTSLVGVEAVVLDECHYMNDQQRGTVWEESVIYCPPKIQLVALSATVANSDQLTDWITTVHGETQLIYSNFRPVPLEFYFGNLNGLFPLLDSKKRDVNPSLKQKRVRKPTHRGDRPEAPSIPFILSQLQQKNLLPAIYFIFSRRGCDRAVQDVVNMSLVNPQEVAILKERIDDFLAKNPEAGRAGQVEQLYRGVAAHHAGILPAWKGLVEELFGLGLVKVVFATETLAAGINMPARTTVISTLSKRTDRGHRLLTASEFLQMAGRAGRRGMDTTGNVVTLQTPFEGIKEAFYLATAGADPLVSQFTPSYGMVLNLLQTHTLPQAKELVEQSFAQYLATLHLKPQKQYISELTAELAKLDIQLAAVNPGQLASYEKTAAHLKEERRLLKVLQQQDLEVRQQAIATHLEVTPLGTVIFLKGKHIPVPTPLAGVLIHKTLLRGQPAILLCLGVNNRWYVATAADVVQINSQQCLRVDGLLPPEDLILKPGQGKKGDEVTKGVASLLSTLLPIEEVTLDVTPHVQEQIEKVAALEAKLQEHPLKQQGDPVNLIKRQKRRGELQLDISDRQAKFRKYQGQHWQDFLNLIEILRESDCLTDLTPTPKGLAASAIRGDNELWVGLVLMSGELDHLEPQDLAAAMAALVTETPRPDTWVNYAPSDSVVEALYSLRHIRRQLFQLQNRYKVTLPIWLEYDLVGIIQQWALGVSWLELCSHTNLDEGDIVRLLRRTVDILSQIPHVPHVSIELQRNAIEAIKMLDRFPVNEALA